MAGGTFLNNDESDPGIGALSTGYFFVLSALLAEATSNSTYLEAATQAQNFIVSHLYDTTRDIVLDTISGKKEDFCSNPGTAMNSFNSGVMIEGMAVLASINQSAVDEGMLRESVLGATKNPDWNSDDGILSNKGAGNAGDFNFPRGLSALHSRNATPPDVKSYVGSYLAAQYNAILDQAAGQSNIYGGQWVGPAASQFSGDNQVLALSVLVPAIALGTITGPSGNATIPDSESTASSTASRAHSNKGAIAGGVVGGVVLLLLVGGALLLLFRRRRRMASQDDQVEETKPTPYPISEIDPSPSETQTPATRQKQSTHPAQHYRNDYGTETPHTSPTSPGFQSSTGSGSGTTQEEIDKLHNNVKQIMSLLNLNDREHRSGGGMSDEDEQPPDYQSDYDSRRTQRKE
ncbi:hypothetical protein V5O48_016583 [Marasmius crinis-equi]|uniref:Glycoside hydrolase family 76 protein n=1 Tax=Marasmius crinis-equi TaxID=585013 RepID=A0ABR3ERA4_9AGAR